ncbi:MAG: M56 family metallopeptidase [Planctomycetota bacterium]|jgi:beta-lactamase regulating signal transducer with metallopeptidase domain
MTDFLWQFAVSNLFVSLAIALAAWTVHRTGKRPFIAHLLWVFVLVKLVTPPLVTLPLLPIPAIAGSDAGSAADGLLAASTEALGVETVAPRVAKDQSDSVMGVTAAASWLADHARQVLILLWAAGSAAILIWSVVRVYRFDRLLQSASRPAPPEVQRMARRISQRLALKATPTVLATSARISPMVWWLGGHVRIVIPAALLREMDGGQLGWILAHELAHIRRRDHLVRWLEWLACVCFWWNPVAWWARRNLRINEEICCDALVLSSCEPRPRNYANALMTVVEFLASPVIRPPAMASEISSGGFLVRRFEMIIAGNPIPKTSRWSVTAVLLAAFGLMPLGLAYAGEGEEQRSREDCEALGRELRLMVENGEITGKQAKERYEGACGAHVGKHDRKGGEKGMWRRMAHALMESGVEGEQVRDVLAVVKKIAEEVKVEGDEFELDPATHEQLVAMDLTDEQIELAVGIGQRIAAHGEDEARHEMLWRRVSVALTEAGIEESRHRGVMGVMKRIVHEMMGAEGDEFELDPRIEEHLVGLELTDAQIELVVGLSQRVASRLAEMDQSRRDAKHERIVAALLENGIARENIDAVMETLRPIIHEIHEEGEAFELDPAIEEELVALDLSDEQIEFIVGMAHRLASRRDDEGHERGDQGMHRRIIGALMESGIERENIDGVMGTLKIIIGEIGEEGEAFELDPDVRQRLEDMDLTDEQIELVVGIAHRVALVHAEENHRDDSGEENRGKKRGR